ncbi:MAG: hypothetical protein WCI73_20640, partial [Phycisphaerae bacterium]
ILGHQHPAVVLADRVQRAKMICFAYVQAQRSGGGADGADGSDESLTVALGRQAMILLPAFTSAALGTNLLSSRKWGMDLPVPEPERIRIAGIVQERVLDFGPLSALPGAP